MGIPERVFPWNMDMDPKNDGLEEEFRFNYGGFLLSSPLVFGGVTSFILGRWFRNPNQPPGMYKTPGTPRLLCSKNHLAYSPSIHIVSFQVGPGSSMPSHAVTAQMAEVGAGQIVI